MSATWPRVVVAGGSIGGLTAALLLRDLGCEVTVYERSSAALDSRGAGIVMHPITARYLVERGLAEVEQFSAGAHWFRFLDRDGGVAWEDRCGYRFTAWNTLYHFLLDSFNADLYHLGREVIGFEQTGRGVTVHLAGGELSKADLLVCADGIASTARGLLLPDSVPHYAGYVGWRGVVEEKHLDPDTFQRLYEAITYYVPERSHILAYPIPNADGSLQPGSRLINFVWYRNTPPVRLDDIMTDRAGVRRELSVPPGSVQHHHVTALHREAERTLPPAMAAVVLETREPFIQAIFDVEVPRMAFGRVCLLGDAAFVARPHTAAGTAKAAADAWELADTLRQTAGDVEAALATWETGQLELGASLVERARRIGSMAQVEETFAAGDPSLLFGLYEAGDSDQRHASGQA